MSVAEVLEKHSAKFSGCEVEIHIDADGEVWVILGAGAIHMTAGTLGDIIEFVEKHGGVSLP